MDQRPLLPTFSSAPPSISDAAAPEAEAASSSPSLFLRLSLFLVLAAFSLLANYETSKDFEVAVLGAAAPRSLEARRFDLLFASNGRAARLVLSSSNSIRRVLYPDDSFPRKPVKRIALYMDDQSLNETVVVGLGRRLGEFVVHMSPAVMEAADVQASVASAVQRGVARVWLWDGRGRAPRSLLDAMADYLAMSFDMVSPLIGQNNASATLNTTSSTLNTTSCEVEQGRLCVARLNRAMQEEWGERMLEDACGLPSENCALSSFLSFEHSIIRRNVEYNQDSGSGFVNESM